MLRRPRTDFWQVGIVPAPIEQLDAERLRELRSQIVWLPPAGAWRYQAGEIALYRSEGSLDHWQRHAALLPGVPGADASLIQHQGRWWMFYAIVGAGGRDQRELHIAHAPELAGPWQPDAGNPVRSDRAGARPAGRPFIDAQGCVRLPVQDCAAGYGSALRLLRFTRLEAGHLEHEMLGLRLTGSLVSDDHLEGFHTLSACGPYTLIDVKRIDRSRGKQWLDLKRRARRLAGRLGA